MISAIRTRAALVAIFFAISAPAILEAQERPVTQRPKPILPCGGPMAVILLKVVDAKGAVIADAAVDIRRERDGRKVRESPAEFSPLGEYLIMDDMALALVPASGARFVVRARRGKQVASTVLRIGRSPDGCHVKRLDHKTLVLAR